MYSVYYHDCNVMKKHCCSCNNHDLVCFMSNLSLKSDVDVQTTFPEKQTPNFEEIDPNISIELFRNYYSGCYNGAQSIAEVEAILVEQGRVEAITYEQYN